MSGRRHLSHSTGHLHVIDPSAQRYRERLKVQVFKPEIRSVTGVSVASGRICMGTRCQHVAKGRAGSWRTKEPNRSFSRGRAQVHLTRRSTQHRWTRTERVPRDMHP